MLSPAREAYPIRVVGILPIAKQMFETPESVEALREVIALDLLQQAVPFKLIPNLRSNLLPRPSVGIYQKHLQKLKALFLVEVLETTATTA